jgi:hypothetical protein
MPTATSSPLAGRTKEATAATRKRAEPSWLTETIHQPRSRRRLQNNRPGAISRIARNPEIRNSRQPIRSGDQTRRSSVAAPRPSMNESAMLIAKTTVPKKRAKELIHSRRSGSLAHQCHSLGSSRPSSPTSRGPLTACRTVA